ncbi:uncharacterized protein LOC110944413 [Helianthus annuus]|uniref:uncharacterized protein LOC110944413 n=1 Tax=Helianthus annuus TaxID=4232 RepID=UPI000B9037FB|nr:uncharacterized protein LOC110944413 [Helianthus annuus]
MVEVEDEEHVEKQQEQEHVEEQQQEEHVDYIFDPRRWEGLNADEIKLLVAKGPKRDTSIEFGPYDKFNRRFSATIYTRTLSNLEKCDREWLAIKLQLDDVREALLEVGETDSDAAIAEEALALAENQLSGFDFLDYKETGFPKAIEEATEIASDMEIDPIFKEKRKIKRKKRKDETSSSEEVAFTVEENFRVNFFLYIVDQAIASLEKRFEQFKWYEGLFGFLFPRTLRIIKDEDLKSSCHRLENASRFKEKSDIDGEALYTELNLFRDSLTNKFSSPVDVLEYMKEDGYSPEACIAYRILLTIPVTVASAERSFSKLKLLKSYLRSSTSQERLSGLAMIAIENEVLDDINCGEVIQQFAIKNARRASRIIG